MSQFCVERNVGRFVERFAPRERLHVANNWDGKDCSPHHRRLAAAISASAPPEGWTEDTAPCAATVVAAETDFAFMERVESAGTDQPAGRSLIRAGTRLPAKLSLSEAPPSAASAVAAITRSECAGSCRCGAIRISQNALRVLGSRRSGAPGAQSTGR